MEETTEIGFVGGQAEIKIEAGNPEAQKYGKLWELEEYRKVSPGEMFADIFLNQAKPKPRSTCIDFGCGTGRGALRLAMLGWLDVTMIDFVGNCLDPDIKAMLKTQSDSLRFLKADLEKEINIRAEYGFCCDVLEHIPPDKLDLVMSNILRASQHVFFSIATFEDVWGELINEKLHLIVQGYEWWLEQFKKWDCVIHWSKNLEGTIMFYVSAWAGGSDVAEAGVLNVPAETLVENVRHNAGQGWTQLTLHDANTIEAMILGGGPSLNEFEDDIKAMRKGGVKLITLNNAYNWALDHGLIPSATVVVDARPSNARFVKPVVDKCKYLISSQCDPSVFEGLPKDRTVIWHTGNEDIADILNENYEGGWFPIVGGSTVLLRAIPLMRVLGYSRFHLFGCDSCIEGDVHHAYSQPENDDNPVLTVQVAGGRSFACNPWMVAQAHEFIELIKFMGDEIELVIYGDGLLKDFLVTGAQLADEAAVLITKED